MTNAIKMTEDEVIDHLRKYLEDKEYVITKCCKGQTRGIDIDAIYNGQRLIIEAKGARSGDKSPTKKREFFDTGQIKNHFGVAIVKILEERFKYPDAAFAIAHPDDFLIKKAISKLIPQLKPLNISFYWVDQFGNIAIEN